ncbi:gluconokinase [Ancrocorticia populi]|uniref:Gluconokinase n=1 Tax=Ancrocorticia populi TaxID=2175228 RepID=A0A2V1K893_9ACTO|nr:gluconokinase [Ancrocorticia populi]PWF25685.1 gluconate kinase [Ancrocorticia populi]
MTTTHLIVMGVAGCGKSTIAQEIADRLGWSLAEGDELHPQANIDKMSAGTPLTDEDRWPWLDLIVDWTKTQAEQGQSTVVTCSALRRSYRDRLSAAPGKTYFVHLAGTKELLTARMNARKGHFMPPALLDSQLDTLEQLETDELGVVVDIDADVDTIVAVALSELEKLGAINQTTTTN